MELLLEIEESLPQWILKRVQVEKYEEFPNRSSKLQTKVSILPATSTPSHEIPVSVSVYLLSSPVMVVYLHFVCLLLHQIYEKIIGFGKAESMGDDDGLPPVMAQIFEKISEQDSKYSVDIVNSSSNVILHRCTA